MSYNFYELYKLYTDENTVKKDMTTRYVTYHIFLPD